MPFFSVIVFAVQIQTYSEKACFNGELHSTVKSDFNPEACFKCFLNCSNVLFDNNLVLNIIF